MKLAKQSRRENLIQRNMDAKEIHRSRATGNEAYALVLNISVLERPLLLCCQISTTYQDFLKRDMTS